MSVKETHYVMFGIKMTPEAYAKRYKTTKNPEVHEAFEPSTPEHASKLTVVWDEEQVVIGKVLVKAIVSEGEGFEFTDVLAKLEDSTKVMDDLVNLFKIADTELAGKYMPKMYVFTQYL